MLREDFPVFQRRNVVYLDSAASTQKPHCVIDAMSTFYRRDYSNVHRGVYPLSEVATAKYEEARHVVANFINAEPDEIIFVKNTTEAINLVAYALLRKAFGPGDTVLTTIMEHHSNFVPWQQLAREKGANFRVLPIDARGNLDLSKIIKELKNGASLLAVTHMSNVLGIINPVREIIALAHRHGAIVLVDGAQSIAHMTVDVKDLDADFYAFSGHKVYGPSGIGVLYGKQELLDWMPPFQFGGDMISEVHLTETEFNEVPYKFEAGTPPVAEAIGLAKALGYIKSVGFSRIEAHEKPLVDKAYRLLASLPQIEIYGPPPGERRGVISFNVSGIHPHDVAGFLGAHDICLRAGHHCAQPLHDFLGVLASVRLSIGVYNSDEDLEVLAEKLKQMKKVFSKAA